MYIRNIRGFSLLLLLFLLVQCPQKKTPPEEELTNPEIVDLIFNYSSWGNTIFVAAKVEDPQELYEGDSVTVYFRLTRPGSSQYDTTGLLYDDGSHGDIIDRDHTFSTLLDSSFVGSDQGWYQIEVQAIDGDGNSSGWVIDSLNKVQNSPPEVQLLYIDEQIVRGDTFMVKCRVSDPQGYEDILAVLYYALRPDSSLLTDPSFQLRDDGRFGDQIVGDGIFTVKQPTLNQAQANQLGITPTPTGIWHVCIYAIDYENTYSDTVCGAIEILEEGK